MRVRHSKQPEAGYVLIAVAGMLVVLVGFTALAIDTGIWFGARTQAQRAADTAALAGAFTFINTPKAIQPATAQNHAIQAAVNNKVMGTAITAAQVGTPDVTLPDPATGVAGKVTVTIRVSDLPTFFAKIFGVTGVTEVHASAEAGNGATNAYLKPFFMPNTIFDPRKPCQVCADICGDYPNCSLKNYAGGNVLVDVVAGKVTAFGQTKIGQQFTVRPVGSKDALSASQFYSLQLGGTGGKVYETAISINLEKGICMTPGNYGHYPVETGAMKGPTATGVGNLIGDPTPRDTYVAVGQYRHPDGNIYDSSDALVTVPIWDPCVTQSASGNFCPANPTDDAKMTGSNDPDIPIIAFASIFIDSVDKSNGGVSAHLINIFPCDGTGIGGSSSHAVPLRLVR